MDRIESMQVFMHVVQQKSFTKAASLLNLPRSSVTDAIKQLEAHLNTRLLNRTTRQVTTTTEGDIYFQRCQHILAYIEESDHGLLHAKPEGILRIDVHGTFASHFIWPHLPDFLARYPDIQLQMTESDRYVDLVKEGIDCAIRIGQLNDSELIARRLGELTQLTHASATYLQRYGLPQTLEDLKQHYMVGFYSSATKKLLPLEFMADGQLHSLELPSLVQVSGAMNYHAAARQNMGIIQSPRYGIAPEIADGTFIEILAQFPAPTLAVSLVYPSKHLISPRVRVFIDWIVQLFQQHPIH